MVGGWLALAVLLAMEDPGKAPPAMLGFVDAAELSEFCAATGPLAVDARMVCLSYVTGAVDQILAFAEGKPINVVTV